jgi:hypothetical protein
MTRRTALKSLTGAACTALTAQAAKTSHRLIAQDKGVTAILDGEGQVEWLWKNGTIAHDLHVLSNGNVLVHTGPASIS